MRVSLFPIGGTQGCLAGPNYQVVFISLVSNKGSYDSLVEKTLTKPALAPYPNRR